MLQDFNLVMRRHVHNEGNFAANYLSHYAYLVHNGIRMPENPPT